MRFPSLRTCSFIALLPLTSLLTGCGDELNCSTDETRQLVTQIADDEFIKSVGPNINQFAGRYKFSLNDVITTEKAKTKTACKAKLHMTVSAPDPSKQSQGTDLNITYNVEKTDDGRLYVTVFGL